MEKDMKGRGHKEWRNGQQVALWLSQGSRQLLAEQVRCWAQVGCHYLPFPPIPGADGAD